MNNITDPPTVNAERLVWLRIRIARRLADEGIDPLTEAENALEQGDMVAAVAWAGEAERRAWSTTAERPAAGRWRR